MWLGFSSTFHATDDKEIVQSAVYVVLLSNCTLPDKRNYNGGRGQTIHQGEILLNKFLHSIVTLYLTVFKNLREIEWFWNEFKINSVIKYVALYKVRIRLQFWRITVKFLVLFSNDDVKSKSFYHSEVTLKIYIWGNSAAG